MEQTPNPRENTSDQLAEAPQNSSNQDGSSGTPSHGAIPGNTTLTNSDPARPKALAADEGSSATPPNSSRQHGAPLRTTSPGQPSQTSPTTPRGPGEAGTPGQPTSPSRASLPPPRTPPLSVEQSQHLIDNVANMSPEARQHPQVQADVAQARDVVENQNAQRESRNPTQAFAGDSKIRSRDGTTTSGTGKVQTAWKPSSHPAGSTDRAAADKWHKRLNELRNKTNPITVGEAISWRPEHPVTPDLQHKIFAATQTFLDMLPRDLVKDLGPVKLSVKTSLDEDASGEYDYMTNTMALSHEKIKMCTPEELRGLLWHEMAHWLYYSAYLNPKAGRALKEWRAKIDAHWARRKQGQPSFKHSDGWDCIRDGLISDYAGRQYPGQSGGIEIPSVYLEKAAIGPDKIAEMCALFPSEEETFSIVMSIFKS